MAAPIRFHKTRRAHAANVYRLLGRDEDALTYALGHLMAIDDRFMIEVLKRIGVLQRIPGKQYKAYRRNYTIHLQELREIGPSGRRDIVIEGGGAQPLRVVFEAKIGRGQPTSCQLLRYTVGCGCGGHPMEDPKKISETWDGHSGRFIVALTRDALDTQVQRDVSARLNGSGIELRGAQWHEILEVALDRRRQLQVDTPQAMFLSEFVNFFREHYEMKTYQAEVMVNDVNAENALIYLNGYMYVGARRHIALPLYFAPYFTTPCVGKRADDGTRIENSGISFVSRVFRVRPMRVGLLKRDPQSAADYDIREHPNWKTRWARGLRDIAELARRGWSDDHQIQLYFLSEPGPLPHTVKKRRGQSQIPPGFATTVFDLLSKDHLTRG